MKKYGIVWIVLALVWAAPVAHAITNGSFETGDYTGWTSDATFTATPVDYSNHPITLLLGPGQLGAYPEGGNAVASTYPPTATTGALVSDPFTLTGGTVTLSAAGWVGNPIRLRLVSDDSIIDEVALPATSLTFTQLSLDGSSQTGNDVYIEVVNNGTAGGGGAINWISVDEFFIGAVTGTNLNNPSFESGDYTGWTLSIADSWLASPVTYLSVPVQPFGLYGYPDNGTYAVSSVFNAATINPGTLTSDPFTLTGSAVFAKVSGVIGNTIRLRRAADDSIVDEATRSASDLVWERLQLDAFGETGEVYVELDFTGGTNNWITVSNLGELDDVGAPDIDVATALNAGLIDIADGETTATLTVSNIGEMQLVLSDVQITGTDAADFSLQSPALPINVAVGGSVELIFAFDPTTGTYTQKSALAEIISNDADETTSTVTLGGLAVPVELSDFSAE